MQRRRLGEILIASKVIDDARLRQGLAEQRRLGRGRIGRVLVDLNVITELQLVKALAEQHQIQMVDVASVTPTPDILALVAGEMAHRHQVLPLGRDAAYLFLAMGDPGDVGAIDELQAHVKPLLIQPVAAGEEVIVAAVARCYPAGARPRTTQSVQPPKEGKSLGFAPAFSSVDVRLGEAEKQIERLRARVAEIEALRARDEDLLRQLCLLLIEKNVTTKDDLVRRMNK